MRMNIRNIIIPWKNKKDLVDVPEEYRKKVNFIPVKTFSEVLDIALVDWDEKKKEFQKAQALKETPPEVKDHRAPAAA